MTTLPRSSAPPYHSSINSSGGHPEDGGSSHSGGGGGEGAEERKEEARRGLLKIMMDKFSSKPLQEEEYTVADEVQLRNQLAEVRIDDVRYDAALTAPEREYLSALLQSGDTSSIQSASAALQNEHVFPKQQQVLEVSSNSSSDGNSSDHLNDDVNAGIVETDSNSKQKKKEKAAMDGGGKAKSKPRRDSLIQQQLFRLHETVEDVQPSQLLQRMNFAHQNSILADDRSVSERMSESSLRFRSTSPSVVVVLATEEEEEEVEPRQPPPPDHSNGVLRTEEEELATEVSTIASASPTANNVAISRASEDAAAPPRGGGDGTSEYWTDYDPTSWNPFEDINSWLDGSQGVEITGAGIPHDTFVAEDDVAEGTANRTAGMHRGRNNGTAPFRILGTSGDDVSCHPHVLSPPLMESLLAFVPEYTGTILTASSNANNVVCHIPDCNKDTTTSYNGVPTTAVAYNNGERPVATLPSTAATSPFNFWLKYSLVRDGASLWTFLRQVRASTLCFLAIETDKGHVFGAFTSQPWRLSKGWYGSKDTFLWKMRRSRLETTGKSIVDQICQESEIQVYPYRTGNAAVQYCSKKCLMLGQGEVIPSPRLHNPDKPRQVKTGKHYGYALYLDKDLTTGTTSSSETFGNPCLVDPSQRGARFRVANIEVWTLTPHDTVAEAEQSELSNLFLDGGRDSTHRLNFMNILVGGPI